MERNGTEFKQTVVDLASQISSGVKVDWRALFDRLGDDVARDVIAELRKNPSLADSLSNTLFESDPVDELVGTRVGHFKVLEKLGEGGMGTVYKASDLKLGRPVALKFLSKEMSDHPTAAARFLREARAAAALNHPHIGTIYETGVHDGCPYLAMEYLDGITLQERLAHGPLEPQALFNLSLQLTDALEAAHTTGIIHRDLKPANIMLVGDSRAKLLDFGLAKNLDQSYEDEPATALSHAGTKELALTQPGATMGTIAYMSPEQIRGEDLDPRSDLFSLGIVLYEAAAGTRPFAGNTTSSIFEAILHRDPEPLQQLRSELPSSLTSVIDILLRKNREERFRSAEEVRGALVAPGVPHPGSSQSRESVTLSTLGAKRSPIPMAIMILGSSAAGASAVFLLTRKPWSFVGPFVYVALGLFGIATILMYLDRKRLVKRASESPSRLRRLIGEQPSQRKWVIVHAAVFLIALVVTVDLGRNVFILSSEGFPKERLKNLLMPAFNFVMYWLILIRAFRWRERPPSRKTQDFEVQGTRAEMLAKVSEVVLALEAEVSEFDLEDGRIRATTSANWRAGWGERLLFQFSELRNDVFQVHMESEDVLPFAWDLWGKNRANLTRAMRISVSIE